MRTPSYFKLYESGELDNRINKAYDILKECTLCPNHCLVNRYEETGVCRSGIDPEVSSFNPHHGEEPPISGIYGSGTIFFAHCTMHCQFCQNYPISQLGTGQKMSVNQMADVFIYLQNKKCHNVNFVTPTHFVPQILKALKIAVKKGFKLPLVYNTSGYETLDTLKILDQVIDVYLPDMKYGSDDHAFTYSCARNYVENNKKAIKEMYRQVGPLKTDQNGIAKKGLIIRHLVLPYNIAQSKDILDFLKEEIGTDMTIGVMSQYFPAHHAVNDDKLKYRITKEEYQEIVDYAVSLGFENILTQGY